MRQVLVLLFPGFEEVEALVPIDLLRRVDVKVTSLSLDKNLAVKGAHDIYCFADIIMDSIKLETFDGLILPGGPGVFNLQEMPEVIKLMQYFSDHGKLIAAICAAPILLNKAGCLPKRFTAHSCVESVLKGCDIQSDVVLDKNIITARGPGAVFPFTFAIIQRLTSSESVIKLKESIHYEK